MAQDYTLYYAIDSLCSYMIRYTLAVRGPPKDGQDISIEDKVVDIHYKREHIEEFFMVHVNPKGKVPAITSPALQKPMADSRVMTQYFAKMFPQLKPAGYEAKIDDALERIHNVPFFQLSFSGQKAASIPAGTAKKIQEKLQRSDLSPEYRKLLEEKLAPQANLNFEKDLFGPEQMVKNEAAFADFLSYVNEQLPSPQGWLFGLPHPSAADAHLVSLLVRLDDVGRGSLIKGKAREYADRAKATPEWKGVMGEYTTTMCLG